MLISEIIKAGEVADNVSTVIRKLDLASIKHQINNYSKHWINWILESLNSSNLHRISEISQKSPINGETSASLMEILLRISKTRTALEQLTGTQNTNGIIEIEIAVINTILGQIEDKIISLVKTPDLSGYIKSIDELVDYINLTISLTEKMNGFSDLSKHLNPIENKPENYLQFNITIESDGIPTAEEVIQALTFLKITYEIIAKSHKIDLNKHPMLISRLDIGSIDINISGLGEVIEALIKMFRGGRSTYIQDVSQTLGVVKEVRKAISEGTITHEEGESYIEALHKNAKIFQNNKVKLAGDLIYLPEFEEIKLLGTGDKFQKLLTEGLEHPVAKKPSSSRKRSASSKASSRSNKNLDSSK